MASGFYAVEARGPRGFRARTFTRRCEAETWGTVLATTLTLNDIVELWEYRKLATGEVQGERIDTMNGGPYLDNRKLGGGLSRDILGAVKVCVPKDGVRWGGA